MNSLRKMMALVILGIFLGAGTLPCLSQMNAGRSDDELDQEQPFSDFFCGGPLECWRFAQSFTPTLNTLTRVKLEMSGSAIVSIRDRLSGDDLTSIYAEKRSSQPFDWVEFYFEDISVIPVQSYYIVCNPTSTSYALGNKDYNKYDEGKAFEYDCESWDQFRGDFAFKTYGYNEDIPAIPDLTCSGSLILDDREPGSIVTGEFMVQNSGDPESNLKWHIESYPTWGEWTFTPKSGEGVTPADGVVSIEIKVIIPHVQESTFAGEIKVVNDDDSSDYGIIPVSISTPKSEDEHDGEGIQGNVESIFSRDMGFFDFLQNFIRIFSLSYFGS